MNIKKDAKNRLNPDHNSGNASCTTNEWPRLPRPAPTLSGGGKQNKIRKKYPQSSPRKNKPTRNTPSRKKHDPKTRKTSGSRPPIVQENVKKKKIECCRGVKVSYPRRRLEIRLHCAGPPVQTGQPREIAFTENLVQLSPMSCSAPEKEEA